MLQIAPWFWDTSQFQNHHYRAPDGAENVMDLRSRPQSSTPVTSPGYGLFEAPTLLPDGLALGNVPTEALNAATRNEWVRRMGLTGVPAGRNLSELLVELLTSRGDPRGLDTVPPLVPHSRRVFTIIGSTRIDVPVASAQPCVERLRNEYRNLVAKESPDLAAKWLFLAMRRTGMDAQQFTPPGVPVLTPRRPTTTVSDNFNQGASDTLGDGNWTETVATGGDWDNVSGAAQLMSNFGHAAARYATALSDHTHWAKGDVLSPGTAGSSDYIGVAIRMDTQDGANRSYYAALWREAATRMETWKTDTGTPTNIGTNRSVTWGNPSELKLEYKSDNSLYKSWDGVEEVAGISDTSLSTEFVRVGLAGITSTGSIHAVDNWSGDDGVTAGGGSKVWLLTTLGVG